MLDVVHDHGSLIILIIFLSLIKLKYKIDRILER